MAVDCWQNAQKSLPAGALGGGGSYLRLLPAGRLQCTAADDHRDFIPISDRLVQPSASVRIDVVKNRIATLQGMVFGYSEVDYFIAKLQVLHIRKFVFIE